MLCIEVSGLLKFCISTGIESLLEHKGFLLGLQEFDQDSVMVFMLSSGWLSLVKTVAGGVLSFVVSSPETHEIHGNRGRLRTLDFMGVLWLFWVSVRVFFGQFKEGCRMVMEQDMFSAYSRQKQVWKFQWLLVEFFDRGFCCRFCLCV